MRPWSVAPRPPYDAVRARPRSSPPPAALRRARRGRGADRGDRAGGGDQPGDRLPALHRQGGAVRAGPGGLPRRAPRRPHRGRLGPSHAADAAGRAGVGVRRLRRRPPGVRRLRPQPDAPDRSRALRRDLRERHAPPRSWHRSCLAALRRPLEAGVRPPATSRSTTPCCWPTPSTPPASAASSSRGSGLVIDEPSPGVPQVSPIGADQVKALLLTSALAMASAV